MPSTRRRYLATAAATGIGAVAGCAAIQGVIGRGGYGENPPTSVGTDWRPPDTDWVGPNRGPRNARYVPGATGPTAGKLAWVDTRHGGAHANWVAAATDRTVYHVYRTYDNGDPTVTALDATDRRQRWQETVEKEAYSATVFGDTLYLGGGDVGVLAIDATDGSERWRTDLQSILNEAGIRGLDTADLDLGTPVPTPDTVYVGSSYGLHGLDPEDGTERWRLVLGNEPNHISNGQTVGSDAVYVADAMGSTLYPVVADAQLPGLDVNAFIRDAPGLVGGRLTLTLERETAPIWSVPESRLPSTLASARNDDGTIAFTSIDIDGAWTFTRPDADHLTDRTGMTTAAADGERIYVTETARRPTTVVASVIGIDATTGRQVWHRDTPIADVSGSVDVEMGQRITAAIVGDNGVYVALTTNADYETAGQVLRPTANEVRRLAPEDGTVRWAVSVPFPPRGLTLAADRLYVWDGNGRLAAVR